jgi:hypothetical protein
MRRPVGISGLQAGEDVNTVPGLSWTLVSSRRLAFNFVAAIDARCTRRGLSPYRL